MAFEALTGIFEENRRALQEHQTGLIEDIDIGPNLSSTIGNIGIESVTAAEEVGYQGSYARPRGLTAPSSELENEVLSPISRKLNIGGFNANSIATDLLNYESNSILLDLSSNSFWGTGKTSHITKELGISSSGIGLYTPMFDEENISFGSSLSASFVDSFPDSPLRRSLADIGIGFELEITPHSGIDEIFEE